ncbi:MAG: bifunctional 4-hydroxy-2-oxoglutarate aldolase/2-dehydro-3-deoxy-phosphogluconate aldolase [Paracoccaceae bacterium]
MAISPKAASAEIRRIVSDVPVIPVLTVSDAAHARPLARALVKGGLPVLEITLRTPAARDAIREMADVPGAVVGVGTLLSQEDVVTASEAGAVFGVSPGATDILLDAAGGKGLPLLPGAATATEAMRLFERGYEFLKFFPAGASGGVPALKSIGAPLPGITFCPTGGIGPDNARAYLALANVACVGGSWVAPRHCIQAGDWDEITRLARIAAALGGK